VTEHDPDEPLEPDPTTPLEEGDEPEPDKPLQGDPTEVVPFGEPVPDDVLTLDDEDD
jgi:hypothetical protein